MNYLPKFFTRKAIALYFIAIVVISLVFFRNSMSVLWIVFGAVEVVGFFYFSNVLTKKWSKFSPKVFEKRLIYTAIALRLVWVVFSYFFYISMNGEPYEFGSADSHAYNALGIEGATAFRNGNFNIPQIFGYLQVGDMGYATYLSFVYLLTDNSLFIARLLKVIWGAWTCLLVYRVATRNFGEGVGRMSAIFCMLMPNLIYYCGLHLKELEMVFVAVAFIERADYLLRSRTYNFINLFLPFLLAFILFTFRTVLGAVAVFSLISAIVFSAEKIVGWQRRIMVGMWVVIALLFFAGGQIATEVEETWEGRNRNQQQGMEYRAQRQGGNVFAKYGTRSLFAPAIFIIPIPSMVHVVGQENQQLIHGGNFVKDIMAFFLLIAFLAMLREKRWKEFTFLGVFMLGYLMVIAFSNFAQSERFHLPAMPIYLMFASFGVSQISNKNKKHFDWYLVALFFILVAWNYIKLAGRGMA